jgi:toxin CptA
VSSRIELTLTPSLPVGVLAVLPWLLLLAFLLIAALAGKTWLLVAAPIALGGATLQYRSNGLLLGDSSVHGLLIEHGKMYAKTGDNRQVEVLPLAASRIWSGLALLKLRPAGTRSRSYTTILLAPSPGRPGNVSADDFRRLRVWLRLGRSGRPST